MRIAIANDHTAKDLKDAVVAHLKEKNITDVKDFSPQREEGIEYPDYALSVSKAIAAGEHDLGLLLCGTGAGMSIAANKVKGIRAVACSEPYTARLTRQHNNTQILCIGARVVGIELAKMIVDEFLSAEFEGGRHQVRVEKIMSFEKL
ncbi:MAG: ribose 5-phosphate isomerase B [Defluviitaleaceae bacterium]|nr:ribose 5-phosphate isomerase B [Defluviitaleaceae bacterium]